MRRTICWRWGGRSRCRWRFSGGGAHALSPGHGKTTIGAYLVGTRATPWHAILLGLTTAIAHTVIVFALGLIALLASQYILPEQLFPWLSLASGLLVIGIGHEVVAAALAQTRRP
ncbi:MAG: hypothetical protein HC838_03105 [Spirulinaceae cyanobacterium RM2_2_10]|nr:hypothetical protein [Spirulinaceae cyanobacterium RM2_2_10]